MPSLGVGVWILRERTNFIYSLNGRGIFINFKTVDSVLSLSSFHGSGVY